MKMFQLSILCLFNSHLFMFSLHILLYTYPPPSYSQASIAPAQSRDLPSTSNILGSGASAGEVYIVQDPGTGEYMARKTVSFYCNYFLFVFSLIEYIFPYLQSHVQPFSGFYLHRMKSQSDNDDFFWILQFSSTLFQKTKALNTANENCQLLLSFNSQQKKRKYHEITGTNHGIWDIGEIYRNSSQIPIVCYLFLRS